MLTNYIKAGYPLLAVKTQEPLRFKVSAAEQGNGRKVIQWDCTRGYQEIGGRDWTDLDPMELPEAAAGFPGSIWLLANFHFFLAKPQIIQDLQNYIPTYKAQGITLIIVCPSLEIPPELARDIVTLDFPMPDRGSLEAIVKGFTEAQGVEATEPDKLIDALTGLTWEEAENALAYALVTDKALNPQTVSALKIQQVENTPGLTFSKFKESFENLGGGENMKTWTMNRFQRRRAGLPFRGVLILGAPGCGKSHFTKALGNEVGWPVLILDLGRVFGSLVGQSEAQLDAVLKIIDALAPCIIIIEEIEKALAGVGGGGSTDGGTTQRVGAKFLTWLQDHESEVFVAATCNDIQSLASASAGAFVRSGRWDGTFFVDLPTKAERRQILGIYLKQFLGKELDDFEKLPDLAGYSGAEIRQVAIEAAYNGGDLEAAVNFVIPLSKSNKDQIDTLRKWAQGRTIPASEPEPQAGSGAVMADFARAVTWEKE
jgi:ATPase family associated with various cellular activities (AAA)